MRLLRPKWKYARLAMVRQKKALRRRERKENRERSGVENANQNTAPIMPPEDFSLTTNYEETVKCFKQLKQAIKEAKTIEQKRGVAIDLSLIKNIQPAAALVLAAELDRWRRLNKIRLKPLRLGEWDTSTLSYLHELGLFKLLEVNKKQLNKYLTRGDSNFNRSVALEFVTGNRNDKGKTDELAEILNEKIPEFSVSDERGMALCDALAEACLNSFQHAYPDVGDIKYPIHDKRWWAVASYGQLGNNKFVKFICYDQGVGIPKTIRSKSSHFAISLFNDFISKFNELNDGQLIKEALNHGNSSTGEIYRGKGLSNMLKVLEFDGVLRLRLISGHGHVTCERGKEPKCEKDYNHHLGGTLAEWTFDLGECDD